MIPRILIDTAQVPGGEGELRLIGHGNDFIIMLGRNELMNSRVSGSEEELAELACARIDSVARPQLLIGGLGMGFTLRAALARLNANAGITVVELVPAVVAWAKGPLAQIFGSCLSDPRVALAIDDVGALIQEGPSRYDAILLDVDNGPDGLSRKENDRLYDLPGLRRTRAALRPGGVLAIWSCAPDTGFTRRLAKAGFTVEEIAVRARKSGRGAHHVIWLATRR